MHARTRRDAIQWTLQMAPLIDVVFLLLSFFILTFRMVAPEGDFNVKAPRAAAQTPDALLPQWPPLVVRLAATEDGRLAGIALGDRPLADFRALHEEVRALVESFRAEGQPPDPLEVVFACDPRLDYEHAMDAVAAVSGYIDPATAAPVPLVTRLRLE